MISKSVFELGSEILLRTRTKRAKQPTTRLNWILFQRDHFPFLHSIAVPPVPHAAENFLHTEPALLRASVFLLFFFRFLKGREGGCAAMLRKDGESEQKEFNIERVASVGGAV